ncbi:MAG: hypothetical protein DWH79_12950 [Planctomycetota bacterium]|nr:MAG: hypothetical protein DWH79_12950 [Planctomycetota bacterium]
MVHRMHTMHTIFMVCTVASAIVAAGFAGGTAQAQVDAAALRAKLMTLDEPEEALTPTAAKETLLAAGAGREPQPIVLAGRINAKGMEPFLENKASFVLLEIPADDHAGKAGHDADNCPFCKKRSANAPMVAVQFVGSDGKVLPLDARKLFGVQKGQEVVVSGKAVFDPKLSIPVIQLTADSIHVRKPVAKK